MNMSGKTTYYCQEAVVQQLVILKKKRTTKKNEEDNLYRDQNENEIDFWDFCLATITE